MTLSRVRHAAFRPLILLTLAACSPLTTSPSGQGTAPQWLRSAAWPLAYTPGLAGEDATQRLEDHQALLDLLAAPGLHLFSLGTTVMLVESRRSPRGPLLDLRAERVTVPLDPADQELWAEFTHAVNEPEVQKSVFWQMDYWIRQYGSSENGWFVLVLGGRRGLPIALAFGPGARDLDPARFRYLGDSLVESMDMRFPAAQRARLRELLHQIDCVLDCSSALEATRPPGRGTEAGVPPAPGLARVLGAVEQALQRGYVNVECCEDEGSGEAALLIPYTLNRELIGTIQSRARRGENSPDGG
jgi:hypothetical protein